MFSFNTDLPARLYLTEVSAYAGMPGPVTLLSGFWDSEIIFNPLSNGLLTPHAARNSIQSKPGTLFLFNERALKKRSTDIR